jgi:hypothetical protein
LIEDCVSRDDYNGPDPYYGYHPKAPAGESRDARGVIFGLDIGGGHDGSAKLTFGFSSNVPPDLAIVTYPLCKAELLAINAVWQAHPDRTSARRVFSAVVWISPGLGYHRS